MTTTFVKKSPIWVDSYSFYTTVACHCSVDIYIVYKIKRFLILNEYQFVVVGSKKNIALFERYANVKCKR